MTINLYGFTFDFAKERSLDVDVDTAEKLLMQAVKITAPEKKAKGDVTKESAQGATQPFFN